MNTFDVNQIKNELKKTIEELKSNPILKSNLSDLLETIVASTIVTVNNTPKRLDNLAVISYGTDNGNRVFTIAVTSKGTTSVIETTLSNQFSATMQARTVKESGNILLYLPLTLTAQNYQEIADKVFKPLFARYEQQARKIRDKYREPFNKVPSAQKEAARKPLEQIDHATQTFQKDLVDFKNTIEKKFAVKL
jgi:hypothetical protein